jgi:hypothetical protein
MDQFGVSRQSARTLTSNKPPVAKIPNTSPQVAKVLLCLLILDVTREQELQPSSVEKISITRGYRSDVEIGKTLQSCMRDVDDDPGHGGQYELGVLALMWFSSRESDFFFGVVVTVQFVHGAFIT